MRRYRIEVGGRTHVIDVQEVTSTEFRVSVGGQELNVTLSAAEDVPEAVITPGIAPAGDEDDRRMAAPSAAPFKPAAPDTLKPMVPAAPPPLPPAQPERGAESALLKAPMPGTITAVQTSAGESVVKGQVLLKLEAMKMVNAIKSPRDGVVSEVRVQAGQTVSHGQVLVTFKEA